MILRPAPHVRLARNRLNRLASAFVAAVVAVFSLAGLAPAARAQYTFRTIAGIGTQSGNLDGNGGSVAPATQFSEPFGIVVTGSGTLFVSDNGNSVIRQITSAGVVTTFAGTAGTVGENNGTTSDPAVTFFLPQGMALDSSGNLYVADYGGATIRKITPAGAVSTFAGVANTSGYANGTGTAAKFSKPSSIAIDSSGNIFVADSGNAIIRKITPAGEVSTFAGTGGSVGSANGKGADARFSNPRGVVVDGSGNVFVADTGNNTIRKITSDGTVTTFAGAPDTYGSADGTGTDARFSFPNALAIDKAGNLYVADEVNATIRKITPAGVVTTLAGSAGTKGRVDGQGSAARFDHPTAIAVDDAGTLYVADYGNELIRKVSATGLVSTIAGTGGVAGLQNGSGYIINPTLLQNPSRPVSDNQGNIYVTDTGNNSIRKIGADGSVTVFAGSSTGVSGSINGTGTAALFNLPTGLARDAAGNLYVADSGNQLIRRISPSGAVVTLAGLLGTRNTVDGGSDVATFNNPAGVAVDGSGNVYVADYSNHSIRMVTPSGTVSTFAGTSGQAGSADGAGTAARFNFPRDLAFDAAGNLWVADFGNDAIRKITPGGVVSTVAGLPGTSGSADGAASAARFDGPASVSVDGSGNVFIADSNNDTIRMLSASGTVSTIGGTAGIVGAADGAGSAARFNHPSGVAVNSAGSIFVADNRNNTVRKGVLPGSTDTSGEGSSGSGSGGGSGGSGGGSGGSGGSGGGGTGGGSGGGTGDPGAGGAYDDNSTGSGILQNPVGMVLDSSGILFVCDTANHCIRKVDSNKVVTTFAGQSGSSGTADGTGTAARFNSPTAIAVDSSGNFYVADTGNSSIRKITKDGVVTTFAGTSGQTGSADGTGTAARFNAPQGIAVNLSTSNVFVADTVNNTIRKITSAGEVTTFSGAAGQTGDTDGLGAAARYNHPTGLTFDLYSDLIVADTYNHTIRGIATAARTVRAVANGTITKDGNVKVVITDAGLAGSPVTFNVPVVTGDVASTWAAKVVAAIGANTTVSTRYTATSSAETIILTYAVADDGTAANLALSNDTSAGVIDAPTSTSTASTGTSFTVAGSSGVSGTYDGRGAYALFNLPEGLATNAAGIVYVADTGNSAIRRVTPGGQVNTIAGIASASGRRNGKGDQALFNQPQGIIAVGSTAIVADTGNSVLRLVSIITAASGDSVVSTVPITTTSSSGSGSSGGGSSGGSSGGGGGGGAPSTWFIAALGALVAARRWMDGRKAA